MSENKHIVFVVKGYQPTLHYGNIKKITDKFVFLEYSRSHSYHETRVKKTKINYKLFNSEAEARTFIGEIRHGSTYNEWRKHERLAEENKVKYKRYLTNYLNDFDNWDKHDIVKFCKHNNVEIVMAGLKGPMLSKTCKLCGKDLMNNG